MEWDVAISWQLGQKKVVKYVHIFFPSPKKERKGIGVTTMFPENWEKKNWGKIGKIFLERR